MQYQNLRNHRWVRRAVGALAGWVVVCLVAWLAVPPLLKAQLQQRASEQLGRAVTVGRVDFRPWTLELTVHDLRVAQAAGDAPQLEVKRLYIDAELQSLLRLAPVVDAIEVDAPRVWLRHLGGGRHDVDDIVARLSQKPPEATDAGPPRFALYNLVLSGGSLDYTDDAVGRTHQLRDLRLAVPFLSNLSSYREVKVHPQLAFVLNGSRFDTAADGTPFAQTRKTDATLRVDRLDLAPYLGYLPASLPLRLQSAVLGADLKLAFEQAPAVAVKLSGSVQLQGVRLATPDAAPLLAFESLTLALDDVRPLDRVLGLRSLALTAPRLALRRNASGQLNLPQAPTPPATRTAASGTATAAAAPVSPAPAWQLSLASASVRGGVVAFEDASVSPQARLGLTDLMLDAAAIQWPLRQPLQFSGGALLAGQPQQGSVTFSGMATDQAVTASATVSRLPLGLAAPYLAQQLIPVLAGQLDARLGLLWRAAPAPGPGSGGARGDTLQIDVAELLLDGLSLREGQQSLASVGQLRLAQARVDVPERRVDIGQLAIREPRLTAGRDAQGRWMAQAWLRQAGEPVAQTAPAAAPWRVSLADAAVSGGQLAWRDSGAGKPVALDVTALQLQARQLAWPATDGRAPRPATLSLSARVGAGGLEPGRLGYQGSVALTPLQTHGTLDLADLPLHALAPYFGDALRLELLRADASFKGTLRYADAPAGASLQLAGDSALEELRANTLPVAGTASLASGEELLSWKALAVRGLAVSMAPGQPTTVDVRETALSDFFARVIISEAGRINLQDLAGPPAGTTTVVAPATNSIAPHAVSTRAAGQNDPRAGPAPVIRIGPVSLVNGKVLFSDRFIKPNYSANLSELTGKLSAFSSVAASGTPALAELELKGRAEGTADLEITGRLNPLVQPLALDIRGRMRDLELPPLSPYSVKYAGHGIQRGKLSMDVNYVVQPNGQLTAGNRLVLNQLSFGDKVEGATASLPVKLAVALLADRNGVIDIDLPISGSLNDPQFRLGPIIFRVIVNLIVKAVTAPFSLLASALGGGGEELSTVAFAPGSAALAPEARAGLDKVARALQERPALRMTVVGTASLDAEREALKRERLDALLRAQKRRAGALAADASVSVTPTERPALLKEVYRRADIPKPRNLVGLARDLPDAEMEALLLANIQVDEQAVRELAVQRGVAVRDYLATRDLPSQRLFLGAAKAVPPEAKWSPRAELNLASP
ncbi:MAG: DUF748 domain-containing protein [Ramlibacter sp.]